MSDMVTISDTTGRGDVVPGERMKVVVEPTGAGRGCLVESKVSVPPGSRVGVILSGGNVDVRDVCRWLGRP